MSKIVGPAVRAADFVRIFNEVRREVTCLRWRFMRKHMGGRRSFGGASAYALDVKAFCVLSHAALEQCFEDLALATATYEVSRFIAGGAPSRTLMSLLLFHSTAYEFIMPEDSPAIRTFDVLREAIMKANTGFSRSVFGNNGISYTHLARLLGPVGLDVALSVDEQGALTELTGARGEHAHAYAAKRILSPEDASVVAYRCLVLARRVAETAAKICERDVAGMKNVRIP